MKNNLENNKTELTSENLERMADVLFEILLEQLGLEQKKSTKDVS